jgi:hypothetical protein
MASGQRWLPKRSDSTPRLMGTWTTHPKTNQHPELGWELLSGGPNEGSSPELSAFPMPGPMVVEGWSKKANARGSRLATEGPRRVWHAG